MTAFIKFMIGFAAVIVVIGSIDMIVQLFIKNKKDENKETQL
jgi:hypothetical protein